MYIKQVIIEGFKSYREQVATEAFSPKHNCVVGANGSGKTNFFHAIRFVLSDLFHNIRAEDRQALLHEGAGNQVMSAFVEIVFDNSDNRMPLDREEVRLRRLIGLKKDEYHLDGKHIQKPEVINLLESAGFSRSNPYYVVQQGKISSLTLMKDTERLNLLKEIGGTGVYEERRKESLKIMQDTENKRKQIIEVVTYIEDRLKELDDEKEELRKYQLLDKQLRSLEYTIFDKEVADAKQQLDKVEEARVKVTEKSSAMQETVQGAQDRLSTLDQELTAVERALDGAQKKKQATEGQGSDVIQRSKGLELQVADLVAQIEIDTKLKAEAELELQTLDSSLKTSADELQGIQPKYQRHLEREQAVTKRLNDCQKQLTLLFQKEGRKNQYTSKAERDKDLQQAIAKDQELINKALQFIAAAEVEMARHSTSLDELFTEKVELKAKLTAREAEGRACHEQQMALKVERDNLHGTRKELQRREADLSSEAEKAKSDYGRVQKAMEFVVPRDARQGMESVKRIVRDHTIEGLHGPLLELVKCDEKFYIAVEVTAGNSLFNVVVETDEVAQRLTRYLIEQRAGRVTFYPLNRIRAPNVNLPNNNDTVPLLKKIQYDPKYKEVFGHVFGRTVICRNLDVATKVARSGDVDCVTMDGDQVERKGAMRGGHHDYKSSKLKTMAAFQDGGVRIEELKRELEAVRTELEDCEQHLATVLGDMEKQHAIASQCRSVTDELKSDMSFLEKKEAKIRQTLHMKDQANATKKVSIAEWEEDVKLKSEELGTDLTGQLSPDERALLERLAPEFEQLREEVTTCKTQRMEVETRMKSVEEAVTQNFNRRQRELYAQLEKIDLEGRRAELEARKEELDVAHGEAKDAVRQRKDILDQINSLQKKVKEMKALQEELKGAEDLYERTLQDEAKEMEQLLSKRILLQQKRDELHKKIRELGSLPTDAFEKYQDKNLKELHKMMHKCNEQLKKFSHVNKKALDQYVNFMEQREELRQRQAELDKGDEKIKELISVLDMRKDESIERTFKGVAKNFREAFAELVPSGHGSLVMMKKRRAQEDPEDEEQDEEDGEQPERVEGGRIEKYIGVRVKVSFTGHGETFTMKQLSGGQKTVVALSLIFAIQRCDPAPFYLFDEIDAALDPQYRTAVGNMIQKQAEQAQTQFITTTFRPELVKVADQVYGVFHRNRVSHVNVISKQDALNFIERDASHQG